VPGANLLKAKVIFVGINLLGCGFLIWKVRSMGLLPLSSADWVSLLPLKKTVELSAGASRFL
jgi:hypothetical protein